MKKSSVGVALIALALLASGCSSISPGPKRLYSLEEESQGIRDGLSGFSLAQFSRLDEPSRVKYRNDWIAARMYAIDINYTAYEAGLTTERQNAGFGASAATLGLTTASGLATSTMSKDILTGVAGAVTGARAAYENDILLAHSVQWIQSQMRSQRSLVGERILRGMRLSTEAYPLAAALVDLEDYYRAGTLTGGILATSQTVAVDAQLSEQLKSERVELAFSATAAGRGLLLCAVRPGAKAQLLKLLPTPAGVNPEVFLIALQSGKSPAVAEDVLQKAQSRGICP